jgi:prepilin peptidase CpaA
MPHPDPAHLALVTVLSAVLSWAAISDIASRRIPNIAVLGVLGLYAVWALLGAGAGLGPALAAAAISFAVGYLLYFFNVMGAGDVKLFAATAPFVGLAYLPLFALATVLSGGAIAAISLIARPRRAAVIFTLRGKGDFGRGVPYGVAIAFGGMFAIWSALLDLAPAHFLSIR